jgi:glycosyltransferase involved in cell wall biosynthesis
MPRVCVIIPTYNWSSVLPFSIRSVLRQTMRDFELRVVGDGCTDDSAEVVSGFDDPRVIWENLPQNAGDQAIPNQHAIDRTDCEVVAYLNHDDLYLPHALESMLAKIDRGATCVNGLCFMVNPNGRVELGSTRATGYRPGDWMTPSCVMHRRQDGLDVGGWIPHVECGAIPQESMWDRLVEAGHDFQGSLRLASIKFNASARRNVYRDKPCHEQAMWEQRILKQDDLEAELLGRLVGQYSENPGISPAKIRRWMITRARSRLGDVRNAILGRNRDTETLRKWRAFKGLDD